MLLAVFTGVLMNLFMSAQHHLYLTTRYRSHFPNLSSSYIPRLGRRFEFCHAQKLIDVRYHLAKSAVTGRD